MAWRQRVIDGDVDRRNGSIVVFDLRTRPEVIRWNFVARGRALGRTGVQRQGHELAIETLVLAHEGVGMATP